MVGFELVLRRPIETPCFTKFRREYPACPTQTNDDDIGFFRGHNSFHPHGPFGLRL